MPTFKYRAFLSYSHRDARWAKWLHRALESYRIDKDLVGRETTNGPVPKALRPIFRDREDFSAAHSLSEQTLAALEASQFLIVVCSPNAAQSPHVNEEIRAFKALGRATQVIAIIIDGEPGDPQRECFPPALRFKLGADGALTDERESPIAADARSHGDGAEIAKQKIVAGLLGIGLDEILRRAERARKRRNLFRAGAAGTAIVVAAVTALGWWGLNSNYGLLRVAEDLNSARDAADLCENAANVVEQYEIDEQRRITLAVECVETFGQVLASLPDGTALPQRVTSSFERYLIALRTFRDEKKLTSEQSKILSKAETIAAQLRPL